MSKWTILDKKKKKGNVLQSFPSAGPRVTLVFRVSAQFAFEFPWTARDGELKDHNALPFFFYPKRPFIHGNRQRSLALDEVFDRYGTYLLPMAFPEGCPTHPAYPAGHAAISGACVTALKAFFDESFVIPNPVIATADGFSLGPYDGAQLKVGDELDKLAYNISLGRDTAGIHWRSDCVEGMRLGEAVSISILTDIKNSFNEIFPGFSLTKFDGTKIII